MYTPEDIELYRRLNGLVELVPEKWEGWRVVIVYADQEKKDDNHEIIAWDDFVLPRYKNTYLAPPLSWLVWEIMRLSYEHDLGWDFGPGEDEEWNVTIFDGVKHSFDAPTPEGACLRALVKILEKRDGSI